VHLSVAFGLRGVEQARGLTSLSLRHGRACPGHPRLCRTKKQDMDALAKRGHDENVDAPVIAGLDPAIHPSSQKLVTKTMDARIKSAHDASGASSVIIIPVCTMPSSFPRRIFCARAFAPLLRSPPNRGEQSAERRSGARRNTRAACHIATRQAPSEAPCVP